MEQNIQYLRRHEIDVVSWDRCIDKAPNGLIYAYSYYLDTMCNNWDALILNDYKAVMPLPWRKKWGIKYINTPAFTQQLGIITSVDVLHLLPEFQNQMELRFKYGSYNFNFQNICIGKERINYVLDLNKEYEAIRSRFKKDLINNLKRASLHNLTYRSTEDYTKAISLFQHHYQERLSGVTNNDFASFSKLCAYLHHKKLLLIREVQSSDGALLTILLCLFVKNRMYQLLSATTVEGRKRKANHFLQDMLIREFSNNNIWLDFEGSDLPGVSHFYQNFGGINQPYFLHQWNKLPQLIRFIKKHKH